jgi:tripartite-type tricarboxylate transporter receptor subunit TctC
MRHPAGYPSLDEALDRLQPGRRGEETRMSRQGVRKDRRTLCAAATALAIVPGTPRAQDFPARVVKIVVNNPAGGPSDLLARALAEALQRSLKQPLVVENRAGAGGNVGAEMVVRAPADGHTLLFSFDTLLTVNPHIYRSMAFRPSDLRPVVVLASSGLMVGAATGSGFSRLRDLIDAGRRGSLNFASGGNGSPGHLAIEVFRDAARLDIQHVPYRGNAPAVMALVGGEVHAGVLATPGMLPHVKAGRITALAVTSRERSKLAPDVPTVAEAGYGELQLEVLYALMAPRQTPEPVVRTLESAIREASVQPEFQARVASLDFALEGLFGDAASARLEELSARYARIAAATGMRPE